MEEIEKLKKIGAREIAKHTHIALNRIQDILECNFKNLKDKATVQGLIQILEREYHVDLQKWQEEHKQFWESYEITEEEMSPLVNFKVTHEAVTAHNSKTGIIFGVVVVLVGILVFVYLNFASDISLKTSQQDEKTQEETTSANKESQVDSVENNATTQALENALPVTSHLDASASAPLDSQVSSVQSQEESAEEQKQDSPNSLESQEKSAVEIVPLANVWVGIVYLDSGKRESFMTTEAFEVNLKRPQTIILGHGMLEVNSFGEKSSFNDAKKMLFMVDREGKFSRITQGQYNEHTRGLGW